MPEESPIVEKIRKLLKKAEGGCTPAEAEAFMSKAQELMTAHGIESVNMEGTEDARQRPLKIIKKVIPLERDQAITDTYIMGILGECYHVEVFWRRRYEQVQRESRDWNDTNPPKVWMKRIVYTLVGDSLDIEIAEAVIIPLHKMMRAMLTRHLAERGVPYDAGKAHSFFIGLMTSFIKANATGREQAMLAANEASSKAYALAVVDKQAAVKAFASQSVKTVKPRKNEGAIRSQHDHDAYLAGKEAGAKINPGAKRI